MQPVVIGKIDILFRDLYCQWVIVCVSIEAGKVERKAEKVKFKYFHDDFI